MDGRKGAGAFLGQGWKFPPKVEEATGRMMTVSEEEDIAEAVKVILFTRKGERIMRPDFGCGIQRFMFAEMTFGTAREMEREITDAIIAWEPRVTNRRPR
ncbi:MAG: GPW/gp25 family protein [Lachnospiraceae bacterium]